MQVLYPGRIEIQSCWFLWREENRRTREKPSRREPTTETQLTYGTGPESIPSYIVGDVPLRHPCSPLLQNDSQTGANRNKNENIVRKRQKETISES